MITFRGAALVAIAIFIFLLARLTQVGWLYLLDAILWGAILLSLVLPWLTVTRLSARRWLVRHEGSSTSPGPWEGETVDVVLSLENGTFWPRYLLSVSYSCPLAGPDQSRQRFFVPRLDRGESLALVSGFQCYKRGLHRFGPVTVESKAPFGLFRLRRRLASPLSALVYPEVQAVHRLPVLMDAQGTAVRPRRTRLGQEISGSRRYVPGDPLRQIHWKNTARLARPMVKEYEDTQDNTLVILFDSSRDMGMGRDTCLEYSIKLAASVASCARAMGSRVRLLTGGMPGHEMPWTSTLKELALLEAGREPGLPVLLESLHPGSPVLALVWEGDVLGMEALRHQAELTAGLAVVALEGFEGPSSPVAHPGIESLRRAGVPVVSCRPGGILGTLRALERLDWAPIRELQVTNGAKPL